MNIFYRKSAKHIHISPVDISVSKAELKIVIIKMKIDFVLCEFNMM